MMPSPQDVLFEFPDAGQPEGVGRVFLRPEVENRRHHRKIGSLLLSFNGVLTEATDRVISEVLGCVARELGHAEALAPGEKVDPPLGTKAPAPDDGVPLCFSEQERALVERAVALLKTVSPRLVVMPSPEGVLIEFPDEGQAQGVGRVAVRPQAADRPRYRKVGPFLLTFHGVRTQVTDRVVAAVARCLAPARTPIVPVG
jgi:hypothetical protein